MRQETGGTGLMLAGWLLAGSGSCSGGVATGWLWEAALAGWLLAGSGSCSGGRDYKAARELGILDR